MIPEGCPPGQPQLPVQATFWMPEMADLDDEGVGFFRDVWTIVDIPRGEAKDAIKREQALLQAIDDLAPTAEDFDRLARCVESWDEEGPGADASLVERGALGWAIGPEDSAQIGGLESGVAGLVYALAAMGVVPAASCRGHTGPRPWSESPVVYFAADEARARTLEPFAQAAGCVFDIDPDRPDLLILVGKSVTNLMRLAVAVADAGCA